MQRKGRVERKGNVGSSAKENLDQVQMKGWINRKGKAGSSAKNIYIFQGCRQIPRFWRKKGPDYIWKKLYRMRRRREKDGKCERELSKRKEGRWEEKG